MHVELDQTQSKIIVQARYDQRDLIKQVPGARWDAKGKVWTLPLSWATCIILRGIFKESITIGPKLTEWSWAEYAERVQPSLTLRTQYADEHVSSALRTKFPERLYSFQILGAEWLLTANSALLGDEMGSGKTVQTLAACAVNEFDGQVLIICPNSVKEHWAQKVAEWAPKLTPYVVSGSAAARRKMLQAAAENQAAAVIINIESVRLHSRLAPYGSVRLLRCRQCDPRLGDPDLSEAKCQVHPKELNQIPFTTVVLDEAHRIKDPRSLQTRACWAVLHGATVERRWALTGTPQANHIGDLWSIMHGICPEEYPTRSTFLDRYALMQWNAFGGMDIIGIKPETRDEFFRFFDPRFRRMLKSVVLPQLPPIVRHTRFVDMGTKQAKAYKEISDGLLTYLGDDLLVAENQLVAATRLIQLASSYAEITYENPDDPTKWNVRLTEPSPKNDELINIADELGDAPFAVSAESRQLIDLAHARLLKHGVRCARVTGSESPQQRAQALAALESGQARALLLTAQAGGEGLSMTKASTLIRLQRSWRVLVNVQTEHRVHRIGSEDTVNIIDIVTRGTIEEPQIKRLTVKLERLEEITRDRIARQNANISTTDLDTEETMIMESRTI